MKYVEEKSKYASKSHNALIREAMEITILKGKTERGLWNEITDAAIDNR